MCLLNSCHPFSVPLVDLSVSVCVFVCICNVYTHFSKHTAYALVNICVTITYIITPLRHASGVLWEDMMIMFRIIIVCCPSCDDKPFHTYPHIVRLRELYMFMYYMQNSYKLCYTYIYVRMVVVSHIQCFKEGGMDQMDSGIGYEIVCHLDEGRS